MARSSYSAFPMMCRLNRDGRNDGKATQKSDGKNPGRQHDGPLEIVDEMIQQTEGLCRKWYMIVGDKDVINSFDMEKLQHIRSFFTF